MYATRHEQQQQQHGQQSDAVNAGVTGRGPALSIDVRGANSRLRTSNSQAQQQQRQLDPRQSQGQAQTQRIEYSGEEQGMQDEGSSADEVADSLTRGGAEGAQREGEDEMMDEEGDAFDSDSMSSSPSIPDDDIDFNLVYALHTFLATVDGQASVVKGDKLHLLDDTNSYWWLVRVIKTQAVGYIPAENIETPYERLARLNKHRNVDLTTVIPADYISGPSSTLAQTRFDGRIPPSQQPHPHQSQHPHAKGFPASPSHKDHPRNISPDRDRQQGRSHSSKAKTVVFTAPVFYEHSANGLSGDEDEYDDEEDDEGSFEGEEGEHGDYDDEHDNAQRTQADMMGQQVFDDDDDGEESEFSDEGLTEDPVSEESTAVLGAGGRKPELHQQDHYSAGHEGERGPDEGRWEDHQLAEEEERAYQQRMLYEQQQQQHQLALQQQAPLVSPNLIPFAHSPLDTSSTPQEPQQQLQRRPSDITNTSSPTLRFDPDAPTKKITATPDIVKDPTFDFNNPLGDSVQQQAPRAPSPLRVRGVEVIDPKDPRYSKLISDRVPGEHLVNRQANYPQSSEQGDTSFTSQESSSYGGGGKASSVNSYDDDGLATLPPPLGAPGAQYLSQQSQAQAQQQGQGKKLKKGAVAPRDSVSATGADGAGSSDDKKRKSGGILSGLFRKKDKKRKDDTASLDGVARTSEDSLRTDGSGSRKSEILSPGGGGAGSPRSSIDQRQAMSPQSGLGLGVGSPQPKVESAESMFSTDAALRQQEVEAKQAMYHQYGVHRGPGDISNSMQPRSASMANQTLSPGGGGFSPTTSVGPDGPGARRMRPGSLIGSPSIPGLDVPLLSVLRVFAGDNIESESTFKTVLLNKLTTSSDLVKQSMQRFRLTGSDHRHDEYFLTVKELGGEERPLQDEQKPLVIFEALSDGTNGGAGGGFAVPSIKRSSIGSISSISSSLSLNPAITRLGMNDFTDDSAVKIYLNRRQPDEPSSSTLAPQSDNDSVLTATNNLATSGSSSVSGGGLSPGGHLDVSTPISSPSFRFAVKVLIHPEDLPDNIVFDPQSAAIIPKSVLHERQQRNGAPAGGEPSESPREPREKIIFFPRNATVSEVIEAGVDRFGIVDAVVDGGDEVEDRLSRRRSQSRVKYALAVLKNGQESLLHASGKLLDAYGTPPIFKPYDRSSKEFRRRSVDATLILGAPQDVQQSDPIFIIRRAPNRSSVSSGGGNPRNSLTLFPLIEKNSTMSSHEASPIDSSFQSEKRKSRDRSLAEQRLSKEVGPGSRASLTSTAEDAESVYETPSEERTQELLARAASPQATRQEIIAAQRAVSRANQRAILSAQKNSEQGVDIVVPDQGTIRSTRTGSEDRVRYSFISPQGQETDISELIESEWGNKASTSANPRETHSRQTTATDAQSFHSAVESPTESNFTGSLSRPSTTVLDDDEEERIAISALRSTPVNIDQDATSAANRLRGASSSSSLGSRNRADGGDVLQDALGSTRQATSPSVNESLQDRLDRVLAKVRDDRARSNSPALRSLHTATPNGRNSPVVTGSGRTSPYGPAGDRKSPAGGRKSPLGSAAGRDSPTIEQIIGQSRAGGPPVSRHGKKPSIASIASTRSSGTTNTDQPSTPVTGGSGGNSYTPISSVNSNHRAPVVYRDDFGLDTLMAIVNAEGATRQRSAPHIREARTAHDDLFGHSLASLDVQPEVQGWYAEHTKTLDDLDARLDALLAQVITV